MNVLRRYWRDKGPKVVAYLFCKFITVLRLKPGDVLIVYDRVLREQLAHPMYVDAVPFRVPLINAQGCEGEEILLFKKMNFKELTAIYQIALTAHQEALCQKTTVSDQ